MLLVPVLIAPEERVKLWAKPAEDVVLSPAGTSGTVPGKQGCTARGCTRGSSVQLCSHLGEPVFADPAGTASSGKAPQLCMEGKTLRVQYWALAQALGKHSVGTAVPLCKRQLGLSQTLASARHAYMTTELACITLTRQSCD